MRSENSFVPFTFNDIQGKIIVHPELDALNLENLDNANRTLHAVQMTREMTTSNGCHVTLIFPLKGREGVRETIAEMFVAALEKGME